MATKIETGITRNQIYGALIKSTHGDLKSYGTITQGAAIEQPEFLARLIAWNYVHGQVRDSKVAIPVLSLSRLIDDEFVENSFAHIAKLDPRNFLRAVRLAKETKITGKMMSVRRLVQRYLNYREEHPRKFEHSLVQHRNSIKELYALFHVKPNEYIDRILFKQLYPHGSIFQVIANLKNIPAKDAAEEIVTRKIPFLIAIGALGDKIEDPSVAIAIIERMSATELVTNTKLINSLGMKNNPAIRAAYDAALKKASTSTSNLFKTTRAIESMDDEEAKEKLRGLQDKQIKASGGIEGNWLVIGDSSGSMAEAIEIAKQVASTIAATVKGKVYLIFADTTPTFYDVTGKSLDQIKKATKHVGAGGGTSLGCGVRYAIDAKLDVDGIAVISDGGENSPPMFAAEYMRLKDQLGNEPTVYLYQTSGDSNVLSKNMSMCGLDMQLFDLRGKVDFYALPNLVTSMRVSRYSLVDEIMGTPLLTLEEVFVDAKAA
jgi:hypothetical protein